MEYYPAIKQNKLLHTITWVDLIGNVKRNRQNQFILYNSIYMKLKGQRKLIHDDRSQDSSYFSRHRYWILRRGSREPYKMMEMFWILILLVVK